MRNTRNIYRIFILFSLALFVFSCGILGKKQKERDADVRTRNEYKLKEMGLLEEEGIITSDVPEASAEGENDDITLAPRENGGVDDNIEVFAAQIFASKSSTEAREFKQSVETRFVDKVIIDYQAPYYRVCVGNAVGYEEAQELLKRINSMGYPKAWLVKIRK